MNTINETHDAQLRSWVVSANQSGSDFPIQNLPFAVFRRKANPLEPWRGGVAIGEQIVDLKLALQSGVFSGDALIAAQAAAGENLNALMALAPHYGAALRLNLSRALRVGIDTHGSAQAALEPCLVAQSEVEYTVPARIGDYTDFFTSIHHATNIGKLFRPDNPLMPNFKWVPIAYHGRASSIQTGPHEFHRPHGQIVPVGANEPIFSTTKRLDFELEVAIWMGGGNQLGTAIPIAQAEQHVFGLGLLNDWSARDIQGWEYQPLGPFLGKNFATTVSPWVVTMEALAPYRSAWTRAADEPQPLDYLSSAENRAHGAFDMQLEAWLETATMRVHNAPPSKITSSNFNYSYWSVAQMVAHHTVGGCNLQAGDVFGSGTMSGPQAEQAAAMMELSGGGKQPITLNNGETRAFLEDGDAITLRARCEKKGFATLGFGECKGVILPAK